MKCLVQVLALATSALLVSCGGGGGAAPSGTQALSVSVVDGTIANALVCLDRNNNDVCDADEPSARTSGLGIAALDIASSDSGKYPVLAMVGTDATDADHGPVPVAYVMKAPADRPTLVSPLTTLVATRSELTGEDTATAEAAVQDGLGTSASLSTDHTQDTSASGVKVSALARLLILSAQAEAQALVASVGSQAIDGSGISSGDLQHAIRRRLLEQLRVLAEQVGTGSVQTALASGSAAQIDAALQPLVARVTSAANLAPAGLAIQVAVDRAVPSTATPVANAHVTYLSYTDAQDYTLLMVTRSPAQAVLDANDATRFSYRASAASSGVLANWGWYTTSPYRQSDLRWNGSTWTQCASYGDNTQEQPDAQGRGSANICGGYEHSTGTSISVNISGQAMTDVLTQLASAWISAYSVSPSSALGAATFPAGSFIDYDNGASTALGIGYYPGTGNTVRNAAPDLASGTATGCANQSNFTEANTLESIVAADQGTPCRFAPGSITTSEGTFNSGSPNEWWGQSTINIARVGLDTVTASAGSYYDTNELLQASFGSGNTVTFYSCQERAVDGSVRNCVTIGSGTYSISAAGDARVLAFQGEPVRAAVDYSRVLVERGGKVYVGYRTRLGATHGVQLNTTATNALFTQLGVPLPDPNVTPPLTPASYQGTWDIAATGTDYFSGDADTIVLGAAFDGTNGYRCFKYHADVSQGAESCTVSFNASTGAATVALPAGTASVSFDPVAGSGSGTFTPGSGTPYAVTVQRR